ncbi:hypothetical protein [Acinetobacter sp. TGL-Y2]|uniref:hypothetical protein n=1 Tax=Acinetobacter sp. TGL-Y2 TaxID=1407071 RepID=UPI000AC848F5|nr:hypothetical protein [Acinetobacter sp. TGL-Y2]
MDRQKLEEKYDEFMSSKHYQKADVNPKYFKRNTDLSRLAIIADNMVCNMLFLKNYFELARPDDESTQVASNYMILVDNAEVALNVNEAPNFRDKEDYLSWFESKLNTILH